jgi:hypothetical protein
MGSHLSPLPETFSTEFSVPWLSSGLRTLKLDQVNKQPVAMELVATGIFI